jgi:Lon protease-like protein
MPVLPMFPLGSVLLPSVFLPLHLFEPRYRAMIRDCLAGDREFGVVLIERGSEVGGGDVRADVGTVARVLEAHELDDGRWAVGAVGTRRFRVVRWLDDDPYPRAEVEDWDDADADTAGDADGGEDPEDGAPPPDLEAIVAALRRVLALSAELGDPVAPATQELSTEPTLASFQIAALSPIGPLDRQALLRIPGTTARLARLAEQLRDEEVFLNQRLTLGDVDTGDVDGP